MESVIIIAFISIGTYLIYQVRKWFAGGWYYGTERIDGKVVIVTGSNTGIGRETALDMVKRGGEVVLACRSLDKARQAAQYISQESGEGSESRVHIMKLDLSSLNSIHSFAQEFKQKFQNLHILIHNAGLYCPYQKTEDGFEVHFGTNHLGPFLLTDLLLDYLKTSAPSRIVVVSSRAHQLLGTGTINFDNLNWEKNKGKNYSTPSAYAQSKLANVLFAKELAKRLQGTGVYAYSLHPGVIATDGQRHFLLLRMFNTFLRMFLKSPTEGAQTTICCAMDPKLANEEASGKYYSDCEETATSAEGNNDDLARRLWIVSEELVGLKKDN